MELMLMMKKGRLPHCELLQNTRVSMLHSEDAGVIFSSMCTCRIVL